MIERDHAQQVVEVLREAFLAADPARVAGADVRVRDVFEAARPRVLALAEDQPHLFAVLADTVAGVELALASDAHAAELAQRGLAAAEAVGADPALIRRLRLTAARALVGLGDLDVAQHLLDSIRALDASLEPDWAITQVRLNYNRPSRPESTTGLLHEAKNIVRDRPPEDEVATEVYWQLAEALRLDGRYEEALEVVNATLAWQQGQFSDSHPKVILSKLRRSNILYRINSSKEVMDELRDIVERTIDYYGHNSSMAGFAHNTLGAALRSTGQNEAAVAQLRLAWQAFREALGEGHANTLRVGVNLALALADYPPSMPEASEILKEILYLTERRFGAESPLSIHVRINLVRLLGRQDQWEKALFLMGSEPAARGDQVIRHLSRQPQIDALNEVLARVNCSKPPDIETQAACLSSQALLDRLLALEN